MYPASFIASMLRPDCCIQMPLCHISSALVSYTDESWYEEDGFKIFHIEKGDTYKGEREQGGRERAGVNVQIGRQKISA